MKQNYLFKLFIFILLLITHMYFYDPSLLKFVDSIKKVSKLKLDDKFLLNSVIWVISFWGMILFLNNKRKITRFSCWALFAISAFTGFAYSKILGESFTLSNINEIDHVFNEISTIDSLAMLQFVGLTALVIIISIIMKPLNITITKTFLSILTLSIIAVLFFYKGINIVLPSFYLIPMLFIYKYVIAFYKVLISKTAATV